MVEMRPDRKGIKTRDFNPYSRAIAGVEMRPDRKGIKTENHSKTEKFSWLK